jgi:hypothetical protein
MGDVLVRIREDGRGTPRMLESEVADLVYAHRQRDLVVEQPPSGSAPDSDA